jgi:hypothetical protein
MQTLCDAPIVPMNVTTFLVEPAANRSPQSWHVNQYDPGNIVKKHVVHIWTIVSFPSGLNSMILTRTPSGLGD